MAATHAPVDAVLPLRASGLTAQEVETIDVWVSDAAYCHGWWPPERPLETIGAQMNIGYAVAVALLDGEVLTGQFTQSRIGSDDVWSLLDRIQVHHDPGYDQAVEDLTRARVRVTTADGRRAALELEGPKGGVKDRLSNDDIVAKARALATDVLPADDWLQIEELVLGLDEVTDADVLVALLARPLTELPDLTQERSQA